MGAPATLPADFFEKQAKPSQQEAPDSLPADFFEKKQAEEPKAAPPPTEKPGFFSRFGQSIGVPTSVEGFKALLPSIPKSWPEAGTAAIKLANPMLGPMIEGTKSYLQQAGQGLGRAVDEFKGAAQNIREGGPILPNIGKQASGDMEAVTGLTPFVGEPLRTAGEDVWNKNYRGALGGMTGIAAQVLAPEAIEEGYGKVKDYYTDPATGITKYKGGLDFPSGKGGERAATGNADVDAAARDLAEIQRQSPMKGKKAEDIHQHAEAIGNYQDKIWDEAHKPQIQRWEDEPVNHEWLAEETRKGLPQEEADANPAETAKAKNFIALLDKPRTIGQLDSFLRDLNNDIKGKGYEYYGPKGIKVRQDAAQAIRTEIDRVLEQNGEPGVREFNRRWGALDNIKQRAQEQAVSQARQEAKGSDLPEWAKPYIFLHPGWGAAYGLTARIPKAFDYSPGRSLRGGLEQLGRSPLQAPEMPPFRLVSPPGRMPPPEQGGLPLSSPYPWQEIGPRGDIERGQRLLPAGEGVGPLRMPPSPLSPVGGSEPTPTGGARGFPSEPQPPVRFGGSVRGIPGKLAEHGMVPIVPPNPALALPAGRPTIDVGASSLPQALARRAAGEIVPIRPPTPVEAEPSLNMPAVKPVAKVRGEQVQMAPVRAESPAVEAKRAESGKPESTTNAHTETANIEDAREAVAKALDVAQDKKGVTQLTYKEIRGISEQVAKSHGVDAKELLWMPKTLKK